MNMQADLNLRLANMSVGLFSDFVAHLINPCPAELIKMPRLLLIFSQPDFLIWIVSIN